MIGYINKKPRQQPGSNSNNFHEAIMSYATIYSNTKKINSENSTSHILSDVSSASFMTNAFCIPNELVDYWMRRISSSAYVVLNLIIRKTRGFQKDQDWISLSQFEEFTGLSRPTIIKAIDTLISKGLINKQIFGILGSQKLVFETQIGKNTLQSKPKENTPLKHFTPPVKNFYPGGKKILPTKTKPTKDIYKTTPTPPKISEPKSNNGSVGGFFDCLKNIAIQVHDKIRLSKKFSEDLIKKVVDYCSKPSFKPNKSLDGAIFYYCKNPHHMTVDPSELEKKQADLRQKTLEAISLRKQMSSRLSWALRKLAPPDMSNPSWSYPCTEQSEYLEINGLRETIKVYYNESGFKQKVEHYLRKFGFPIPQELATFP